MECLENIIGLTQNDCDCFRGDKPADFADINASDSGLYITDDGDGAPLLAGVYASIDCGRGDNVFSVLKKARENAISSFLTDLGAYRALGRNKTDEFSGLIGRLKSTRGVSVSAANAGIMLNPKDSRGRQLVVEGVHLGFTTDETTTVTIQSDNPDFDAVSFDVVSSAGKYGYGAAPAVTMLDFSDGYNYALTYPSAGKTPLDNDFTCCGSQPEHERYARAYGFTSEDVANTLQSDCIGSCGHPYGMAIKAYTVCEDNEWLCQTGDDMKRWMAKAIQLRAAANLYQYILDSDDINYFTVLRREAIYGKRNSRLKGYETNTKFIAQQSPKGGCTGCTKSIIRTRRGSLT